MTDKEKKDIKGIIFDALVNSKDNPLKISGKDIEKFAEEISAICDKHAFSKDRDSFMQEIDKTVKLWTNKSGDDN